MKKALLFPLQVSLCTFGYLYSSVSITQAQVTSDGTVNTVITTNGNVAEITGGETREGNLFHSFQDFSVGTGNEAFFDNGNDISNIFSRVTGGNISNIDGLIRANDANLFLINPAGILFGAGARLDLGGGSFYGSSASSILFEDGEFSATDLDNPPVLTVNAPIGLNFRDATGDITVNESVLQVNRGETLVLVGGDLILEGSNLIAEEGRIELGSTASNDSNNLVNLNQTSQGFVLDYGEVQNFGEIQLTQEARVETSGEGGGAIQVQGERITLVDGSTIIADTLGSQNGSGINIETNQLIVRDGSIISSSSVEESQGNSGGININAVESVELIGTAIGASSGEQGNNSGGGQGNNSGGGQGNNSGEGQGNNNDSREGERPSQIESDARGNGQAGDLIINTSRLFVLDGARISASTIDTPRGGNITINASESVEVSGVLSQPQRPGGLSVQTRGVGQAGELIVNTANLIVRDGAEISASTFGEGDGGNIDLTATESLKVIGASEDGLPTTIVAETGRERTTRRSGVIFGTGNGGDLTISTAKLLVQDQARISVSSNQSDLGNAGNLEITANSLELNNGILEAETAIREGGNIRLQIDDNLNLRNNSTITARALQDANGGNISIDSGFIIAFPDGNNDIIANASIGNGGNININAESLLGIEQRPVSDLTNDIDASSAFSLDGSVTINTPDINTIQGVTELPSNIVEPKQTTAQACQANREIAAKNNFIIKGKGGIPAEPGLPLDSQNISINGNINSTSTIPEPIETSQGKIQPARGIKVTESGGIILTAYRTNNSGERIPEIQGNCG